MARLACEQVFVPGSPSAPSAPSALGLAALDREICELFGHITAAMSRWLTLVAEFDRRGGHESFGFASCSTWLAWRCSIAPRAAREHVRVARALGDLPAIASAFASGSMSYSKVRVLTRVAEPEMEAELVEMAQEATAAQLERLMRGYRGAIAADDAERAAEKRHLSTHWDDDGSLRLSGSLPPEEGALLMRALEIARRQVGDERDADAVCDRAVSPPPAAAEDAAVPRPNAADALVALAENVIAGGVSSAAGGERNQMVVHVDASQLVAGEGAEVGAARATVDPGISLSAETVRRLGCDASVVMMVERDGAPLSVGRKTRSVPPSIVRALKARDRGCRFPGCDRNRYVDAHHIDHWAHGGETSLRNLVQLCRHHHRLVHEGGFSVEWRGADPLFRRPSGAVIEPAPIGARGSPGGCVQASRRAGGGGVGRETCRPRSAGERMDLGLGVFALAALRERRRGGS